MIASFRDVRADRLVRINLKTGAIVLSWGSDPIWAFDASGRFLQGVREGRYWQRGLDHRLVETVGVPARHIEVPRAEAEELLEEIHGDVIRLAVDLAEHRLEEIPQEVEGACPNWEAQQAVAQIVRMDPGRLFEDSRRYLELYGGPVPVLPPDLYRCVYLQAVRGCTWSRCRFCSLYGSERAHRRSPESFADHVRDVKAYFGPALAMRHAAFLGDADILAVPQPTLLEFLDILDCEFDILPAGLTPVQARHWHWENPSGVRGLYGFATARAVLDRSTEDLARLARRGLRRLTMGLDTGCRELSRQMLRPGPVEDVPAAFGRLKDAGIAVAVTVIAGLGGDRFAARHVEDTLELVRSLPIAHDDLVYVAPLIHADAGAYAPWARSAHTRGLTAAEINAQVEAFRSGLGPERHVVPYDLDRFLY